MVVVSGLTPGATPEPAPTAHRPRIDVAAASRFLRSQADCLGHGLAHADQPVAVRAVLRAHDNAHGTWLTLIAATEAADRPTGDTLGRLYAFHGRVAGALERRLHDRPCAAADRGVRALLASRLRARTDESVRALSALPSAPGQGGATS